jgi:hypothetical protein
VPLIRRGTSHIWNNLLVNYRKDVLSIRVGAQVLWDNNPFVINAIHQEKESLEDSLAELSGNLIRDVEGGSFQSSNTALWFSDASCVLNPATETPVVASSGQVADLSLRYTPASRALFSAERALSGQALVDYISATAGKYGRVPFNSPLAPAREDVLGAPRTPCQ